jgi:4-hydroxybenzoate polyprenyltransferase
MPPKTWLRTWLRTLRVHQWSKNVLLGVALLASHSFSLAAFQNTVLGIVVFCLSASGVYVFNDWRDRDADRLHPTKRFRPMAAGTVKVAHALTVGLACFGSAFGIAIIFVPSVLTPLCVYLGLTFGYIFGLKRLPILDLILLTSLYTTRVWAGAAVLNVTASDWLIVFSVFTFLALSTMKRMTELVRLNDTHQAANKVAGRGYEVSDGPLILIFGVAASFVSILVFCLYVTSAEVRSMYSRPKFMFLFVPILLWWHMRMWLSVTRKEMNDDPVAFALRDPISYMALAMVLGVFFVSLV